MNAKEAMFGAAILCAVTLMMVAIMVAASDDINRQKENQTSYSWFTGKTEVKVQVNHSGTITNKTWRSQGGAFLYRQDPYFQINGTEYVRVTVNEYDTHAVGETYYWQTYEWRQQ